MECEQEKHAKSSLKLEPIRETNQPKLFLVPEKAFYHKNNQT